MSTANPDVILHIPQAQFQAVQTRFTDFLLQSQYAFVQSFSSGCDTAFEIFSDRAPAATLERVQLVLCQAAHGTSMTGDATPPRYGSAVVPCGDLHRASDGHVYRQ